ncbi:thymidylate synthase [Aphanothece hegewaldii CCALA 016]|uniref:Thymidylate synthase n=1 Tax=Aphanothece hegewaldii CCALA 016 TaxID=2107694 RepID=A0A2T1LSE2_9CHRO|nr:FAD-dependent thymidylate synthase [Aphanothece hegewaldii]PSF32677.1 thymidylate synthase [Aphanothece hegewaldii CCALA 016]
MVNFLEEPFSETEGTLLQPFVTNLDQSVFGLRNLPEVVKGALFSRYSRSDKSLRRILLDEFIKAPEANFSDLVGSQDNANQIVAIRSAEAFYDRVLIGYGDDSVAELGGAHLACEGISNIAAKALEDSRLGISPLEKSTRYVPFNRKINGYYRYYREPSILSSKYADNYEKTLDYLFDTYTTLIEPLLTWLKSCTPKDADITERAYNNATRAKALDLLRGLLPMATLTNVGLFGNGRAFEYLLVKLAAFPHHEVKALGSLMQQELDKIIPSFVKRAKSDRGAQYIRYLSNNLAQTQQLTQKHLENTEPKSPPNVQLVEYDKDAETKVIAAILYPHTNLTFKQVLEYATHLSTSERIEIINTYIGERATRFHRPGRAFEETYYTFDILADLGAYRDLHRHRVMTQERQRYTVIHGYDVPIELEEAKLAQQYRDALDYAAETTELISKDFFDAAQYLVPFAYKIRWRIKLNLREVYHLAELRSSRQGHPSYRIIAQEMYQQIKAVHPTLTAKMSFVDMNDYALERLAAEQRIDEKLQSIKEKL